MGSQVLNEVKQQSGVNVNSQRFSFWLHTEVESVQAWPEKEKKSPSLSITVSNLLQNYSIKTMLSQNKFKEYTMRRLM